MRNQDNISKEIILAHTFILGGLVLIAAIFLILNLNPEAWIYWLCVILTLLLIWSLWSWYRLTHSFFNPYVIFLIVAYLFNGGQAILEVFHLNSKGILNSNFQPRTIIETIYLVTIGLAAFHYGAILAAAKRPVDHESRSAKKGNKRQITDEDVRSIGWALIIISIIPTMIVIRDAISVVMAKGYFGMFEGQAATGFGAWSRLLSAFLIPGALFLLAGSRGHRIGIIFSSIFIIVYSVINLFLGSRIQALMPLIAFAWLWHYRIKRIPRPIIVIALIVVLVFVIPSVGIMRDIPGENRSFFQTVSSSNKSTDNPAVSSISEMGGSMGTIAYTLELVPSKRKFDLGVGYIYSCLTLVPNFFWKVHPTIARGTASDWLISQVNPAVAALGGGYGYSFIAEAYLNFGWYGAIILLALIGFLLGKFVIWAVKKDDAQHLAMLAAFLAFFLFFARNESANIVRAVFWYSVLPYFGVYLVHGLRSGARKQDNLEMQLSPSSEKP